MAGIVMEPVVTIFEITLPLRLAIKALEITDTFAAHPLCGLKWTWQSP